jgi:hypothetical protein
VRRGGIGARITGDGVNRAVKAALVRYYLGTGVSEEKAKRLAARFSGQSGRVGFVVAAKVAPQRPFPRGDTGDSSVAAHVNPAVSTENLLAVGGQSDGSGLSVRPFNV